MIGQLKYKLSLDFFSFNINLIQETKNINIHDFVFNWKKYLNYANLKKIGDLILYVYKRVIRKIVDHYGNLPPQFCMNGLIIMIGQLGLV